MDGYCGCAAHLANTPSFCFLPGGTSCANGNSGGSLPPGVAYIWCDLPPLPPAPPPLPPDSPAISPPPLAPNCVCINACGYQGADTYRDYTNDGFCDDGGAKMREADMKPRDASSAEGNQGRSRSKWPSSCDRSTPA